MMLVILSFSRESLNFGDFINYRQSILFDAWSLYFIKEFVFWGLASAIHEWTRSFEMTVYLMDAIFVTFLMLAMPSNGSSLRCREFALPMCILLSFPILMGFTNIYRQIGGLSLFLYALYLYFNSDTKKWQRHSIFIISGFCHNVFLAFYLLFLIQTQIKSQTIRNLITFSMVASTIIVNELILKKASVIVGLNGVESGGDSRLVLVIMNVFAILNYKSILPLIQPSIKLQKIIEKIDSYQSQIWGLLVSIVLGIYFLEESTSERLLTLCLIISLYLIVYKFSITRRTYIGPIAMNTLLAIMLILPAFVSKSATQLIFPQGLIN